MSLINDALKRAKQAQQDTPLPELPGPQLRPVEPEPYVRHGIGLVLPIVLASIALLILFFVWQYSQRNDVRSRKSLPAVSQQTLAQTQEPASSSPTTVRARAPESPSRSSAGTGPSKGSIAQTPAAASGSARLADGSQPLAKAEPVAVTTTNEAPAPVIQPPKPAPPRLQGIVFNPRRPSAVISGRILFIGDRFGEFRVRSIDRDSVVLVGLGQTNVLRLEE